MDKAERLFDENVTIEEVEELWKQGWEIEINNGVVTKARLLVKEATYEGVKKLW